MRTRIPLALLTAAFACSFAASAAMAARDRVFVASYGTDSGNTVCSFTQPCRTFQNAIANVAVGGEITAIDSAGFGPVTITQSVTITSPPGVEAGIVPNSGGNAVTISPNFPQTVITLRGLTLEGGNTGQNGIIFSPTAGGGSSASPAVLNIIGCVVKDFSGDGILLEPNFPGSGFQLITIADSSILNNGGNGIEINPPGGPDGVFLFFTIDHTTVSANAVHLGSGSGILINSSVPNNIQGTISSSEVTANNNGLSFTGSAGFVKVRVRNSILGGALTADVVSGSSVANVYLFANQIDFLQNSAGTVFSDGSNNIFGLTGTAPTAFPRQ